MRKARLILTWDCPRQCVNCANDQIEDRAGIPRIDSVAALDAYDEVILTGGEPMLDDAATLRFVQDLRERKPDRVVYVYTALWSPVIFDLLDVVDGLHYTIHAPMLPHRDVYGLGAIQSAILAARRTRDLSCRLYVQAEVDGPVLIYPSVWDRVEIAPFRDDCPVPRGETLLVWAPNE